MDRKSRARQLAREADPALSDEESAAILGLVNIGDEKALDLFDDLSPAEVAGVVKWYLKQRETAGAWSCRVQTILQFVLLNHLSGAWSTSGEIPVMGGDLWPANTIMAYSYRDGEGYGIRVVQPAETDGLDMQKYVVRAMQQRKQELWQLWQGEFGGNLPDSAAGTAGNSGDHGDYAGNPGGGGGHSMPPSSHGGASMFNSGAAGSSSGASAGAAGLAGGSSGPSAGAAGLAGISSGASAGAAGLAGISSGASAGAAGLASSCSGASAGAAELATNSSEVFNAQYLDSLDDEELNTASQNMLMHLLSQPKNMSSFGLVGPPSVEDISTVDVEGFLRKVGQKVARQIMQERGISDVAPTVDQA